tara:strand:- start:480 stop:581 length:102 start_codon:yes stop_codon:yes gene_type:complete
LILKGIDALIALGKEEDGKKPSMENFKYKIYLK